MGKETTGMAQVEKHGGSSEVEAILVVGQVLRLGVALLWVRIGKDEFKELGFWWFYFPVIWLR